MPLCVRVLATLFFARGSGELMKRSIPNAVIAALAMCAVVAAGFVILSVDGKAQHHDHKPATKTSKPKAKAKRRTASNRRRPARVTPPATSKPGMNMPGPSPSPSASPGTHLHTPGMQMPSPTPKPQASPDHSTHTTMPTAPAPVASPVVQPSPAHDTHRNMPMPSASPTASPGTHTHTPGMQMPSASPQPTPDHSKHMPMPSASPSASPMGQMPGMETEGQMVMSDAGMGVRLGASKSNVMNLGQMGSGTSWQPDTSPMNMLDKIKGKWLFMFHYNAVIGGNAQGGPRGVTKFESANWFMPIGYRRVGPGTLQLRGMFSLEPFTFAPGGSPLLFQTGETYKGESIIDAQHPHDLFMELSASYIVPLGERATWYAYFGYPGEPALGPVAFMHRTSASENPSAVLGHHLQDSTHISFGVLTTGFTYRWFKLEGSIFNGREPDESRYDFDAHKWNSRSARLWFTPNKNWAMQISHGFLKSPEVHEPEADIRRTTASVQYNKPLKRGNWASAFIWGRNHVSTPGEVHNLNSYTAESTVNFLDKNYLYTRLELVDKNDLLRSADRALLGITQDHPSFRIGGYTLGGARDIWDTDKVSMAIGSDVTFYSKPSTLNPIYGNNPVSWRLFLRIRPGKMDMQRMHKMHGSVPTPEAKPPSKP